MANDKTERLLNQIGQILAEDLQHSLDGTLLYAEVDENMVAPSIFKLRGNHILYRWPDLDRISDALLNLWAEEKPGKRWAELEFVVRNGKFAVTFTYPEEIDPEEESSVRRDRIVKRHFGDKPIVYPPWPDDGGEHTFKV